MRRRIQIAGLYVPPCASLKFARAPAWMANVKRNPQKLKDHPGLRAATASRPHARHPPPIIGCSLIFKRVPSHRKTDLYPLFPVLAARRPPTLDRLPRGGARKGEPNPLSFSRGNYVNNFNRPQNLWTSLARKWKDRGWGGGGATGWR